MSYIGNTLENQNYVPAIDYFNGDGSTTAFTLSRPVASVAQVQATISNVPQNPGSAFTVSGSTITFTSAPPSGSSNIYVYYTSPNTQVVQPGHGTVYPASLSTGGPTWTAVGNFGVGVTPVATSLGYSVQLGNQMTLTSFNGNSCYVDNNIYYDGGFKYTGNGYGISTRYTDGSWVFSNAPLNSSGAGAAATLTEKVRMNYYGIGLGASTPSSGMGITFPATQSASSDANTLDDYEEGTWTTTFGTPSNLTGTPTLANATYTKIGRLVTITGYISGYSATSTNTLTYPVINVPFPMVSGNVSPVAGACIASVGSIFVTGTMVDNSSGEALSTAIVFPAVGMTATGAIYITFTLTYQTST